MLMEKATKEMIDEWINIFNENKDKLKPNKKTGLEIIEYLKENHSVIEIENLKLEVIVHDNIVLNEFSNQKLCGKNPTIRIFEINDDQLYDKQDSCFRGQKILVGIEMNTSYYYVEGSSYLFDQLVAFTGLDEKDITNYFIVAQYIMCKSKFSR